VAKALKNITMRNLIVFFVFVMMVCSCKKDTYPGGKLSPIIGLLDIKHLYKGKDVTLTKDNMIGAHQITGVVVSEHSGGNLPHGLLVMQDSRRLALLRGISISLGDAAANYHPGDSIVVEVEGGILKRVDGILEITGLTGSAITKVSSGNAIPLNRVTSDKILANPDDYESTLAVVVKGGFDPLPAPTDVLAGDKTLNDGFGNLMLHTDAGASFANTLAPVIANFYGITFNKLGSEGQLTPQFYMRTGDDVVVLSSTIEITPVLITGFLNDPAPSNDGNYEYIQLMATRDIDFSVTPFALVTTNNANASKPAGFPAAGWATGVVRTYKFNLDAGKVSKGSFFYVGGTSKVINGPGSADMSNSNWIGSFNYSTTDGKGFGSKTGNLLANSGNAFGMAVFADSAVTVNSRPVDVIFIATGGSLYTAGPPAQGYRITNTDFYDVINPITLEAQPFYRQGSNTISFSYISGAGMFNMLGGVYNSALGRWTKARAQTAVVLGATSGVGDIEGNGSTTIK